MPDTTQPQIEQIFEVKLVVRTLTSDELKPETVAETIRTLIHTHEHVPHYLIPKATAEVVYTQRR